jgi:hypothetical protein
MPLENWAIADTAPRLTRSIARTKILVRLFMLFILVSFAKPFLPVRNFSGLEDFNSRCVVSFLAFCPMLGGILGAARNINAQQS